MANPGYANSASNSVDTTVDTAADASGGRCLSTVASRWSPLDGRLVLLGDIDTLWRERSGAII